MSDTASDKPLREEGQPLVKTVNASDVRVKVERIHIDGVGRTKGDILVDNSSIKNLLGSTNLQQAIFLSLLVKQHFDQLGIFKKCKVFIDTSKGQYDSIDGIDITFKCKEFRGIGGGISTAITSANEPSLTTSLRLPNVWGRAEKFNLEYSYGSKKTQNFQAVFTKPVFRDLEARVNAGLYQSSGEYPWSAYCQKDRGVFTNLTWESLWPVNLIHTVQWDLIWRNMGVLSYNTPFDIRRQCGHTLKEAIKYSVGYDNRDNSIMPLTGGWMWKLTNELAGLVLGNVSYIKTCLEVQYNQSLPLTSLLQACINLGQMSSWDMSKPPGIIDNYHLGGPLNFRGFELNSIGSGSDGYSQGANTYWSAGLHLYTPLPFRPGKGGFGDFFKTHAFINAGNLVNVDRSVGSGGGELGQLFISDQVRLSCGAGIVFILGGVMRIELNYCLPILSQQHDKIVRGLQFGIGASYT